MRFTPDLARDLIATVGASFALDFARDRQWLGVVTQIQKLLQSGRS